MRNARRTAGVSASLALLAAWGCGEGPPSVVSDRTEATVKGTVKINGKPASTGSVVFDPTNINRTSAAIATAPIGKDGTYSAKTLVGENRITLAGKDLIAGQPELQYEKRAFVVKSGENTFDIDITIKK